MTCRMETELQVVACCCCWTTALSSADGIGSSFCKCEQGPLCLAPVQGLYVPFEVGGIVSVVQQLQCPSSC